jgi:hypothetical protein
LPWGNALGLLCFYLCVHRRIGTGRFQIPSSSQFDRSRTWKRFHIVVESYDQKKQLSTEYSVMRGRNSTLESPPVFDIEKSAVLYWKLPGNVSKMLPI